MVLALLTILTIGSDRGSASTSVGPRQTGLEPAGAARLALVGQTPFVSPTDTLRIDLDVTGAPTEADVTFTVWPSVTAPDDPGTAQARFDAWVDGSAGTQGNPFNSPKTFALASLPPADGSGRINASFQIVPEGAEVPLVGFAIADPGVYPFTVTLTEPEGGAVLDSLTTYLVRLPTDAETAPPLTVAPVVDVHAPVALRPDGTRALDPAAIRRTERMVDALASAPSVPVTVDATPETLEALAGAGPLPPLDASADPTDAGPAVGTGAELIGALQSALVGRSVLGSTYVDIDLPAWTSSGMDSVIAYQISHGANVTEAVLPERAPVDSRTWVADTDITADALTQLRANGIEQVVLPESIVGPVDPRTTNDPGGAQARAVQPFTVKDGAGDELRAVTAHPAFGRRLVTTDDPALNAQILVADLAVTYLGAQRPRVADFPTAARGVTFTVPDDELAFRSLGPFLTALGSRPSPDGGGAAIVSPATLDGLFAIARPDGPTDGSGSIRSIDSESSTDGSTDMGDYPDRLDDAELALSAYESMVVDTAPQLVLPLRQLLDVSGAAGFDATERQQYLDTSTRTVHDAVGAVQIPDQDQVTLTQTEYELPVFLENGLAYPVEVTLTLASPKLTFPDGDQFEVRLDPGRNRVPVRVETVSGGTFSMSIDVATPDNRRQIGSDIIEIRSTAISGLGLILSIGAGFFLLVWWVRNWRKSRRRIDATSPPTEQTVDSGVDPHASFTVGSLDELIAGSTGAPGAGDRPEAPSRTSPDPRQT